MSKAVTRDYVRAPWGQIHFFDAGSGDALLLYPNRPRSIVIYRRLGQLLAERYRVIAIDPPGFGGSDPLPEPYEVDDLTRAVITLLDELGVERFRMSGHHSGATMCVALTTSHPERVLAIAPTGLPFWTDDERRGRLDGTIWVPATGNPPKPDGAHLIPFLKRFPPKPFEDLEFVNEWIVDSLVSEPALVAAAAAIHRFPIADRMRQVRVPTLIVQSSGLGEPPYLQRAEEARKLVPGSEVATLEGADIHFIHHRAEELAALLVDFFARTPVVIKA